MSASGGGGTQRPGSGSPGAPAPLRFMQGPATINYEHKLNPLYVYINSHIRELRDKANSNGSTIGDASRPRDKGILYDIAIRENEGINIRRFLLYINRDTIKELNQQVNTIGLSAAVNNFAFIENGECHVSVYIQRDLRLPLVVNQDLEKKLTEQFHITLTYQTKDAPGENKHIRIYFTPDGTAACIPDDPATGWEIYDGIKSSEAYMRIVTEMAQLVAAAVAEEKKHQRSSSAPSHQIAEFSSNEEHSYAMNYGLFAAIKHGLQQNSFETPFFYLEKILKDFGYTPEVGDGEMHFMDNILFQNGNFFNGEQNDEKQGQQLDAIIAALRQPGHNKLKAIFILDLLQKTLPISYEALKSSTNGKEPKEPLEDILADIKVTREKLFASLNKTSELTMKDALPKAAEDEYRSRLALLRVEVGIVAKTTSSLSR